MAKEKISEGVVHELPNDVESVIVSSSDIKDIWESLTPLARNEWVCWITSAKKEETRDKRLKWMCDNLREGKRRPCCWPGCPHR